MKVKSLCATALIVIGGTVLAATPSFATSTELTSKGSVEVKEGQAGGDSQGTIDPENPANKLPEPDEGSPAENTNPDTGSLVIEKTTDLSFGQIATTAGTVNKYAAPMSFGETGKRGAYVQWADIRSGGTYGYTITAELTKQFTSGTNVLTGSTITFTNPLQEAEGGNENIAPSTVNGNVVLSKESGAVTVINANKTNKEGKGRYIVEFGQSNVSPSTVDKSVQLTVPATTASNMATGSYEATVTWKIAAVPA